MNSLRSRRLARVLIAVAAILTQSGTAQTPDLAPYPERATLNLRSSQNHGGTSDWQKAVVPGTVLNSLVNTLTLLDRGLPSAIPAGIKNRTFQKSNP